VRKLGLGSLDHYYSQQARNWIHQIYDSGEKNRKNATQDLLEDS